MEQAPITASSSALQRPGSLYVPMFAADADAPLACRKLATIHVGLFWPHLGKCSNSPPP
jgi:hypothetical protein